MQGRFCSMSKRHAGCTGLCTLGDSRGWQGDGGRPCNRCSVCHARVLGRYFVTNLLATLCRGLEMPNHLFRRAPLTAFGSSTPLHEGREAAPPPPNGRGGGREPSGFVLPSVNLQHENSLPTVATRRTTNSTNRFTGNPFLAHQPCRA